MCYSCARGPYCQGELYKKWKLKSHKEINSSDISESDASSRPNPRFKYNTHVKDELRNAQQIKKLQQKRASDKLKNMSKERRKKVLGTARKTNKDTAGNKRGRINVSSGRGGRGGGGKSRR